MDVHCFLFTDMLLVCKPMGKKGEKMKVIRQPFVVDRLVTREFTKDTCSFGLVYLNEYGTASAALSFHSNEPKAVKMWLEHIKKAHKLYVEAKGRASVSHFCCMLYEYREWGLSFFSGLCSDKEKISVIVQSYVRY